MSEAALLNDQATLLPHGDRRRRFFALGLVLAVSFSTFTATSLHHASVGQPSLDPGQRNFRILVTLLTEAISLLLLWFVLSGQRRSWRDIGWAPKWRDIPEGLVLIVGTKIAAMAATQCFQLFYLSLTGHYLRPRSFHSALEGGISFFSILFVLLNPFFEELIVRAYTMSEVLGLGGSQATAVLVSIAIQMSYHTYQGLLAAVPLLVTFAISSIYFARTRRIAPVIILHLYLDALALIKHNF